MSKVRKVWIVIKGEKHEGGSVEGVYATKNKAVNEAMKVSCSFGGGWSPIMNEELSWENGCDYLTVEDWEVA